MDKEGAELPLQTLRSDKFAREKIFLAEQAAEGGLKVLPGKKWAFHYPRGADLREKLISDLLTGKAEPEKTAADLRPDGLVYDASDIDKAGLASVVGKVRDISSYVNHYDYPRFAEFAAGLFGTEATPQMAQALYDGIAQSRIRKKVLDAYGYTGKKQMEDALKIEAETTMQKIGELPKLEKVLAGLKLNWMAEDLQVVRTEQRDQVLSKFSPSETQLYEQLKNAYSEYVKRGEEETYAELVKKVKEQIPKIQLPEPSEIDKGQEELEQELEQYMDEEDISPMPGMSGGIDNEISPAKEAEKGEYIVYAEITPSGTSEKTMVGYYIGSRSSKYDIDAKSWIPDRKLSQYGTNIKGDKRQTTKSTVGTGLSYVHVPNGYGLDMSSLKFTGSKPEFFRDQNGCFYIRTNAECNYSIDFLKEDAVFISPPIDDDTKLLHRGLLSPETENMLNSLTGDNVTRAEQVRSYLLSLHYYPGDGDIKLAVALQRKLGMESTGDNYIQNLEKSEYLECLSANNLYTAMLRKIGIPARLVNGHKVEDAKDGKAILDSKTAHAWAEVWDGKSWRRMDATPNPKQQKKEDKDKNSSSEEAKDEGIDRQGQPSDKGQGEQDQKQQDQEESQKGSGQQMGEASDRDMQQGESDLSQAKEFSEKIEKQKAQLDQKAKDAKSFKELKDLEKETLESELFDEMKKDLEEKLEAKEKQLKEEIKDKLEEMTDDGFMDEKKRDELAGKLDKGELELLDRLRKEIEAQSKLYDEYQSIREEIMPYVDEWYKYFAERLPRETEVEQDEDSLTRQGAFNRHSIMKPRNLLFGTVKNPRVIRPSIKPKFLALVMLDVSDSMEGEKLNNARKLLIFYNELFSKIGEEFGFIRYSNNIFADNVAAIKAYNQDYNSSQRYDWEDKTASTVKARLMQSVHTQGGTNMLPAIQKAAKDLYDETVEYPDYASALYFVGDGGDTSGNAQKIKEFLQLNDAEHGFGNHMLSAIMLGDESQRQELAAIFGDEHTTVAPDFGTLIQQSMYKFDDDIKDYLRDKTV